MSLWFLRSVTKIRNVSIFEFEINHNLIWIAHKLLIIVFSIYEETRRFVL